tara:strand:+ start:114 stop:827 length:714 start_codon:yes stop_codon:yes gene_type:complete
MLKYLLKPIFIVFVLTASNPALASGYKDSIEQCLAAHQAGDKGKVKLIASEIASIKMYGDQTRIDAAKCMTHAFGGEWVYDHSAKAMVNKNAVVIDLSDEDIAIARAERQKKRDKLAQLRNDQTILENRRASIKFDIDEQLNDLYEMDERLQNFNLMVILKETHSSCSKLYYKNKEATIINPTCIEAFKKLGHPLLDKYEDAPSIDRTQKEINRLKVLKSNVQAQIDDTQEEINSIE